MSVHLGKSYLYDKEASPPKASLEEHATTQKAVFDNINRTYETDEAMLLKKDRLAQEFTNAQRIHEVENEKYLKNVSKYNAEIASTNSNLMQRLQDKHRTTTMNIFQQKEQMDHYLQNKMTPYSNIHHMYDTIGYDRNRDVFQAYNFELIDKENRPITNMRNLNTQMDILIDAMNETNQDIDSNFQVIGALQSDISTRSNLFYSALARNQSDINLYAQTFSNDIQTLQNSVNEYVEDERKIWNTRISLRETTLKHEFDQNVSDHVNVFKRMAYESQVSTMSNTKKTLADRVINMHTDIQNATSNINGTYNDFAVRAQVTLTSTLNLLVSSNVRSNLNNVVWLDASNIETRSNIIQDFDKNYVKGSEFQQYIIDQDVQSNVYTNFVLDTMKTKENSFVLHASDLRTSNSNVSFQKMYDKYIYASNTTSSKLQRVNAYEADPRLRGIDETSIKIHKWKPTTGYVTRMEVGNSKWQARSSTNALLGSYLEIDRDLRVKDIRVNGEALVNAEGRFNGGGSGTESISSKIDSLQGNLSNYMTTDTMNLKLQDYAESNHDHEDLNLYQRLDDPSLRLIQQRIANISNPCIMQTTPGMPSTSGPCFNGSRLTNNIVFESDHFAPNAISWTRVDWNNVEFPQRQKESLRGICSNSVPPNSWTSDKITWGTADSSKIPFTNAERSNIPMNTLNISMSNLLQRLSITTQDLADTQFNPKIANAVNSVENGLDKLNKGSINPIVENDTFIEEGSKVGASSLPFLQNLTTLQGTNVIASNITYKQNPMVFLKDSKKCIFWDNKIICNPQGNQVLLCNKGTEACHLYDIRRNLNTSPPQQFYSGTQVTLLNTEQATPFYTYINPISDMTVEPFSQTVPSPPYTVSASHTGDESGCAFDTSRPVSHLLAHSDVCNQRSNATTNTHRIDSSTLTLPLRNQNNSCQLLQPTHFATYMNTKSVNVNDTSNLKIEMKQKIAGNEYSYVTSKTPHPAPWSAETDVNVAYIASNCPIATCTYNNVIFNKGSASASLQDYVCNQRTDAEKPMSTASNKSVPAIVSFTVSVPAGVTFDDTAQKALCGQQYSTNASNILTKLTRDAQSTSKVSFSNNDFSSKQCAWSANGTTLDCTIPVENVTATDCFVGSCANNGAATTAYHQVTPQGATSTTRVTDSNLFCSSNPGATYIIRTTQPQRNQFTNIDCTPTVVDSEQQSCPELKYTLTNETICLNSSLGVINTTSAVNGVPQTGHQYNKITLTPATTATEINNSSDVFVRMMGENRYSSVSNAAMKVLPSTDRDASTPYYKKNSNTCSQTCGAQKTYQFAPSSASFSTSTTGGTTMTRQPIASSWNSTDICSAYSNSTPVTLQYKVTDPCVLPNESISTTAGCCVVPACTIDVGGSTYDLRSETGRSNVITYLNNNCPTTQPTLNCSTMSVSNIFAVNASNQYEIKTGFTPPNKYISVGTSSNPCAVQDFGS